MAVYYTGCSQDTCFNQMVVNPFSWPSSLFLFVLVFTYKQKVLFQLCNEFLFWNLIPVST